MSRGQNGDEKMTIQICVGSSCHIKGSAEIVERLQNAIAEHHLENEITLAGSFCSGKCNREGVTIHVDEEVHTGISIINFEEFFREKILAVLKK